MAEIHRRQFPTKSSRMNLLGPGVIGSGPEPWPVLMLVEVEACLAPSDEQKRASLAAGAFLHVTPPTA